MTEKRQVYKCAICGNIVEVLHEGQGTLVCCGQPMEILSEKKEDVGREKHVPVIEKNENGVKIRVGEIPHPMEDAHYIEWIEAVAEDGEISRKFLSPKDKPEAQFASANIVSARIYCNVHGLWSSK